MRRLFLILLILVTFPLVTAQTSSSCNLVATVVDQDPFPAVPGEYVDLVFQITGVNNPACGSLSFQLKEEYPLIFDPGFTGIATAESGVFARNFRSFWLIPFKVRVDSYALNGDDQIEATLTSFQSSQVLKFDLKIKDTRTDFEVHVEDYDSLTQTLTFEILNIGENDIEALTIEIPTQENIEIKGSKRNIVGSLDSNEDSTFSFEAKPHDGDITLTIIYTDTIGERRTLEKTVTYNSSYFTGRIKDQTTRPVSFYLLIILIIGIIVFFFYKRWKKQKAKKKHAHHLHHSSHSN